MSQLIKDVPNRIVVAWSLFVLQMDFWIERYRRICLNLMIRGKIDDKGGVILSTDIDERFLLVQSDLRMDHNWFHNEQLKTCKLHMKFDILIYIFLRTNANFLT